MPMNRCRIVMDVKRTLKFGGGPIVAWILKEEWHKAFYIKIWQDHLFGSNEDLSVYASYIVFYQNNDLETAKSTIFRKAN